MEVGQEAIDEAEAIARRDEQARLSVKGSEQAVIACRAFQQPERGGADRHDLPSPRLDLVQGVAPCRR